MSITSIVRGCVRWSVPFTSVRRQGGELKLLHLTNKVHDVMQITKLYTIFDILNDEAVAIKSFGQSTATTAKVLPPRTLLSIVSVWPTCVTSRRGACLAGIANTFYINGNPTAPHED